MIRRMPGHYGDDTCSSCVIAGDFIYLAHHAGGFDQPDVAHQMRAAFESLKQTLESVCASLQDMVQINLYLKDTADFDAARAVFSEFFESGGYPVRMTTTTGFISPRCLCMLDGVAYKPAAAR